MSGKGAHDDRHQSVHCGSNQPRTHCSPSHFPVAAIALYSIACLRSDTLRTTPFAIEARIMPVEIADRWFETRRIDDDITLLWEPHVIPPHALQTSGMWRGRDRDLVDRHGHGASPVSRRRRSL